MVDSRSVTSGFYLTVTGQIDGCQMTGYDNLYVKYSFAKGPDWSVLAGVEHGVSQISKRSSGSSSDILTWNYPLDIMFRSSNVHGWPQVVIGVYGLTVWGGDVIRGYGCTHVPTIPGRYTRYIQLYTPISSSLCQRLTAWITNNPPEFFDSKFIAQGKGREVTRVRSHGCVKVTFNVTTKNMSEWGYQVSAERTGDMMSLGQQQAMLERPLSSAGASSSASGQQGPGRATLSASTAASLAAARTRAAINPPSGLNSRESSLIRRNRAVPDSMLDTSMDEQEAKYPPQAAAASSTSSSSVLGQRPSPTMRPASGVELQPMERQSSLQSGGLGLAPLRTGPRQF